MVRILVTGGRDYRDTDTIRFWIGVAYGRYGTTDATAVLVHGGAPGADRAAAYVASSLGWCLEAHDADWEAHGSAAGPIRNRAMVAAGADVCVAFPGGRGTAHCARLAREAGIPVIDVVGGDGRG